MKFPALLCTTNLRIHLGLSTAILAYQYLCWHEYVPMELDVYLRGGRSGNRNPWYVRVSRTNVSFPIGSGCADCAAGESCRSPSDMVLRGYAVRTIPVQVHPIT